MANKKNKVKYNLKNVHYALLNIDEEGNVPYGTPVPIPCGIHRLDANGEPSNSMQMDMLITLSATIWVRR